MSDFLDQTKTVFESINFAAIDSQFSLLNISLVFFFSYIRLTCNNNNFIASLCNPNQWQVFVTVAQKQNNSIVVAIILVFFFFHFSFVWFVDEQIYTLNIINNAVILINKSEINLNANAEKSPANSTRAH